MGKKVMIFIMAAALAGILTGCGCEHEWQEATCTEPKTCALCGKTEGEPAGHQWSEATCINPKTCTVCGETEGETVGHDWKEATCTEPKICTMCGETEGDAVGHQWVEATEETPKTCTVCKATEGEKLKKVIVSEWGVDYLKYISDKYLMTKKESGKYALMDYTGKLINTFPYAYDYPVEWDYIYTNLQDGCFIGIKKLDDGYYRSRLIDGSNLHILAELYEKNQWMTDFRDNIITIKNDEENRMEYRPYYEGTKFEENFVYVYLNNMNYITPVSYKTILWDANAMRDIDDSPSKSAVMQADEDTIIYTENKYTCEEYKVIFNNDCVNNDGWVWCTIFPMQEAGGGFAYGKGKSGFYNIQTNEFQECLTGDSYVVETHYEKNGCNKCSVIDDYAVMQLYASENKERRIYNIKTGLYENDDIYTSINLGYWKNLLVQNLDREWGYIDSETYEHVGEWYDDASDFCNGFALVNKDGKEYVINEDLEIVSNAFEGESAHILTYDYFDFSDLNGKSVFAVMKDGKYHLVTLE